MKKNMALCFVGIIFVVYAIAVHAATLSSSIAIIAGTGLIVYSVRNKIKRVVNQMNIVSFI